MKYHFNDNATTFALLDVNYPKNSDQKSKHGVKLFGKYPPETFFRLHPASLFIIAEVDLLNLNLALQELKNSIYWNVYGFFMIQNIYPNSCHDAYEYFNIIWSFNILSAIFICMDLESTIRVHTFNPYSNYAPSDWTEYKNILQNNGHPMVLLQHDYTEFNSKLSFKQYIYFIFLNR